MYLEPLPMNYTGNKDCSSYGMSEFRCNASELRVHELVFQGLGSLRCWMRVM